LKVQIQDVYHGPALMQIVEHNSFKALNKADEKYGHYLVNTDTRLWFKYASASVGPWQFTFQPSDLGALRADIALHGATYVVLACGHHSICCLGHDEIRELVDLDSASAQWIKVDAPPGKQMRVIGSRNSKSPVLAPHSRFPNCIFGG
jgi:hypothetical protein